MSFPGIKLRREMFESRICFVCGKTIPETKGCVDVELRVITHHPQCTAVVDEYRYDRSRSQKGKRRLIRDVLRLTWERFHKS